jgi:hypothetical protein
MQSASFAYVARGLRRAPQPPGLPKRRITSALRLLRTGLSRTAKLLDLQGRLRCHGCGRKGRAVVSIKWRAYGAGAGVPGN